MASEVETSPEGVVILDYAKLKEGHDYSKSIEVAFGYDGIGLLVVKNVPNFVELRGRLLPMAYQFSKLPEEIKEKVVHAKSKYSYGWSHGKEVYKEGQFDTYKGSYYNNPQYDEPCKDKETIEKYIESAHPNIWPTEDFPQLRPAFMELGQLICDVGTMVGAQCDRYAVSKLGNKYHDSHQLEHIIRDSKTCKARLLYYFPIKDDQSARSRDSWCGWHNDHSALTGLCSAMFIDERDEKLDINSPDPESGLYCRTRANKEFKVKIPRDCIGFQIGESSQVVTGGLLRATPHAVQALAYPSSAHIGRSTLAVFMQPDNEFVMRLPEGADEKAAAVGQYKKDMTFIEFHKATIAGYYSD